MISFECLHEDGYCHLCKGHGKDKWCKCDKPKDHHNSKIGKSLKEVESDKNDNNR